MKKVDKFGMLHAFCECWHYQRGQAKAKNNYSTVPRVFQKQKRWNLAQIWWPLQRQRERYMEQKGHCPRSASLFIAQTATDEKKIENFRQESHKWHEDLGILAEGDSVSEPAGGTSQKMSSSSTVDFFKNICQLLSVCWFYHVLYFCCKHTDIASTAHSTPFSKTSQRPLERISDK